jgi:hypothetical protein
MTFGEFVDRLNRPGPERQRDPAERLENIWRGFFAAIEDFEAEDPVEVDEPLVQGLAALQLATDQALARLERQLLSRLAVEVEPLQARIAELEAARAADEKRHKDELAGLRRELASLARTHDAAVAGWRSEIELLAAELAEQRSLSKLRDDRTARSHDAKVSLQLARAELAREAAGKDPRHDQH